MKFGFESEKLLLDLKNNSIYNGVFHLVDALSDFVSFHGESVPRQITNEFVLNMVEMNTIASPVQSEVIENYLLLHQIVSNVCLREHVVPLPLAAVPFHFTPVMSPKWAYYVQNCILSGKRLREWGLSARSPLADAGNCAGLHVHFEIETLPEFLAFSDELMHKHNLGLMLTPMVAFSASPYFYEEHSAYSMRAHRYYHKVYEKFPLNGGLAPMMRSSAEVLAYALAGMENWISQGVRVGFSREDLVPLTTRKSPNWSMLRWNRTWNTIELRCMESDRVDYDISKFTWVVGAMKRLDLRGEALEPECLSTDAELDSAMIDETFRTSGKSVSILSTSALHALTARAVQDGIQDELVERYLHRLAEFAQPGVDEDCQDIFQILKHVLDQGQTTADRILEATGHAPRIDLERCLPVLHQLLQEEKNALQGLRKKFAGAIPKHRATSVPSLPGSSYYASRKKAA